MLERISNSIVANFHNFFYLLDSFDEKKVKWNSEFGLSSWAILKFWNGLKLCAQWNDRNEP